MLRSLAASTTLGLTLTLAACATTQGGDTRRFSGDAVFIDSLPYLARAHSHNNYDQRRPLFGALGRGVASIEVDVVLQDGELYVAHGPDDVDERITLRGQYLDPLRNIVANAGTVYGPERPSLQLLIDVKTDADATYATLHRTLGEYSSMLTAWHGGRRTPGPVTVVISGNRPVEVLRTEDTRYAALDGRILDDREDVSPDLMPLVSEDWEKLGPPVPEARLARARRVVEQMHAEGRKVRFWGTPEDEELWASLVALGVDYIGTDQVDRLDRFLRAGRGTALD